MTQDPEHWMQETRSTLLERLKDLEDESSWRVFFDSYAKIIHGVAVKSGLQPQDAQDVVQETVVSVAKHIGGFEYDRSRGSFKSWLLTITRSKIITRWRRNSREPSLPNAEASSATSTSPIEKFPDPASNQLEEIWEREWQQAILSRAMDSLKKMVDPAHFQVFDCLVNKGWSVAEVENRLGVKPEQAYLIKSRVTARLKEEVTKVRRGMEKSE